ncbi:MAG: helix-turn-helix domain-containing protein, partial [Gammaproteobacteria bacterium]|nr:helix-turn-helix domain-containing protein [Gammaproteobacteria bacterium]
AQLGEYVRARALLKRAARAFGRAQPLARARCAVAEAEVALALRDFSGGTRVLEASAATLTASGDEANAALARLLLVRRLLLLGRLEDAALSLAAITQLGLPPALAALRGLLAAELALRALTIDAARAELERAATAARRTGIAALAAEVATLRAALTAPAARCVQRGESRALGLAEIESLRRQDILLVDACRRSLRVGATERSLARRPLLFALARSLASAWPEAVTRERLIEDVFHLRRPDDSLRARLRVELGRLRRVLAPLAAIEATAEGFRLRAPQREGVRLLLPPLDGDGAELLALLADGAPWSTSALALALGASQRSVQRALAALKASGRVRALGRARAQRWLATPLVGFTPILLLPANPASL